MKNNKVLHFPLRNNRGGIAKYILENWQYINREEFSFDFITFENQIDFRDKLLSEGCIVHNISCYPSADKECFYKEVNRILDNGYDAIHLHTSRWTGIEFEEIAMERGVPNVIVHSHNTSIAIPQENTDKYDLFSKRHERIKTGFSLHWKQYATNLCACSDMAGRWLFGNELADNEVYVMKNAVDTKKLSYNRFVRERYRRELNLGDRFVIGHVGRFSPQKNHEFIFEVFHEIAHLVPSVCLLLIGGGPKYNEINEMLHLYGLENNTILLGLREDVPELMQAMDAFILPSLYEGLGIALVEAQAAGLLCFTSDAVPPEAKILPDTLFLPLNKSVWREALIDAARSGYERRDQAHMVDAAGYSIRESVKVLERLYKGELRR